MSDGRALMLPPLHLGQETAVSTVACKLLTSDGIHCLPGLRVLARTKFPAGKVPLKRCPVMSATHTKRVKDIIHGLARRQITRRRHFVAQLIGQLCTA
jgi:hypothetical protein